MDGEQRFDEVLHGLEALGVPYRINNQLVRGLVSSPICGATDHVRGG